MSTRRTSSTRRTALLLALCTSAISLPLASLGADTDYNTRSPAGSSSSVGSDTSTSGTTSSATGNTGSTGSSTGTNTSTDTDRSSNRSSTGTYIKDSVITAKVKAALARDKEVTARNIKVETDAQGVVTLSGDAKTQTEADRAATIARTVDGVTSVTNNIRVP